MEADFTDMSSRVWCDFRCYTIPAHEVQLYALALSAAANPKLANFGATGVLVDIDHPRRTRPVPGLIGVGGYFNAVHFICVR